MPVKYSAGIACCRCRQTNGRSALELLLVQRPVSYAFQDLVLGRYRVRNVTRIRSLLREMTREEQSELLSYNFVAIWWRATKSTPDANLDLYKQRLAKFTKAFGTRPGGLAGQIAPGHHNLADMVHQSLSQHLNWGIPKGRAHPRESALNCATREFHEETGINKRDYHLIFTKINYTYEDSNITYSTDYYPAFTRRGGRAVLRATAVAQSIEVLDMRWMTLDEVRAAGDRRLTRLCERVFDAVRAGLRRPAEPEPLPAHLAEMLA